MQVWSKDAIGDDCTASGSPKGAMPSLLTELEAELRGVMIAADNAVTTDELMYLRNRLLKTEGWREHHWTLVESCADAEKELETTEIVVFSNSGASLSATGDRWGEPRLLNPFAKPIRSTDSYGSGDANLDGKFDSADVAYTQDIVGQTRDRTDRADVNGDGEINSQDITMMREVLAGGRGYLPGWWEHLRTREERDSWVDKMLAIDRTDGHPYQHPFFVCGDFASVLVLNNAGYDGTFVGEPSKWITPGRFNLPMQHVTLTEGPHAITGILVGDDPLQLDSWRFIEPQTDSDAAAFTPGERIFVQVSSHFTSLGRMSSARALVIFDLDENGNAQLAHADPELVIRRLGDVTVHPMASAAGHVVEFTARISSADIAAASAILRRAGSDVPGEKVSLYDDGLHGDGAAGDGVWGGTTTVDVAANFVVDLTAELAGGGETTYRQADWLSTAEGTWYVSPSGSDSNPGSRGEPFQTVAQAVQVAFPGDAIVVSPGVYPQSIVINKGGLSVSGSGDHPGDVSVLEIRVDGGTATSISNLSCQSARPCYASNPVFAFCEIENLFESVDAHVNVTNCRVKQIEARNSSLSLRGSIIRNPDGPGVAIRCPRTTDASLVPLEILNCTLVNSQTAILCTADDEDYPCTLWVINSILWDNVTDIDYDYPRIRPIRCDIASGWPGEGENIRAYPLFADPAAGDYSLLADSPCIDAGDSTRIPHEFQQDIAGNPRVSGPDVDIGAYEYGSWPFRIVEIVTTADSQAQLRWNSRPGDTYAIWSCADLANGTWIEETTVLTQSQSATWTDPHRTAIQKFYKIELK